MYEKLDKKYILSTYAKNYTQFTKGKNATLFDKKGRDFIDFTSGIGVVSVGHGNKKSPKVYTNRLKALPICQIFIS